MEGLFKAYAATEENPKWNNLIKREKELYSRNNDIRSEFERDYTRIIHSTAYRRMKHKTQIFFSPQNDHICTRIEHIVHVESVSSTIAKCLGLNRELTRAIATAHDLGHSPFGHQGEHILSEISKRDLGRPFWHEKNGLEMVDKIELLEDNLRNKQNLNLTYAVRDGIISHCGEVDENKLKPREECIDLKDYKTLNQYAPYTWEGCVVKIADKISYLGRDIEDAITLGILDEHLQELHELLNYNSKEVINNTVLISNLIYDLWQNSNVEEGLCFSKETYNMIKELKVFSYKNIYQSDKVMLANKYFEMIINAIYDALRQTYNDKEKVRKLYPMLVDDFESWISNYWNLERKETLKNDVLFDINNENDYIEAIIYYLSGMTDNYAINTYQQMIGF